MSQAKRASKRKRPSKAVSVLGIAGASLGSSPFQFITLGDEEISDVSLATFHLFDKFSPIAGVRPAGGDKEMDNKPL
jgi:hypothetical protein